MRLNDENYWMDFQLLNLNLYSLTELGAVYFVLDGSIDYDKHTDCDKY